MGLFNYYTTDKTVKVASKKFYAMFIFVNLAFVISIIGYVLVYQKKYQKLEDGITGTTVEMRGIAHGKVNLSTTGMYDRVWDSDDLMHSPSESQTFFLTTNLITSHEQTLSECPELAIIVNATCNNDSDCLSKNVSFPLHHGFSTGKCNTETRTCQINAWCPVERPFSVNQLTEIVGLEEFILRIDGYVYFPKLDESISHSEEFKIAEIVRRAHSKTSHLTYLDIARDGGIISIELVWNCDFNPPSKPCVPEFSFERLDFAGQVAQGHTYHYTTNYYKEDDGIEYRRLHRAFGIRFIMMESAIGGKFDFLTLLLNFGSTLGYFSIVALIFDKLAEWCLEEDFKKAKYEKTDKIEFRSCRNVSTGSD